MNHAVSSPAPPRSRSNIETPSTHFTRVPRIPRSLLRQTNDDVIPELTQAGSSDDVADRRPGRRTPISLVSRPLGSGVPGWDIDDDDDDEDAEEWEEPRSAGLSRSQTLVGRVHGITRTPKSSRFSLGTTLQAETPTDQRSVLPRVAEGDRAALRHTNDHTGTSPPLRTDAALEDSGRTRPRITFSELMAMGAGRRDPTSLQLLSKSREELRNEESGRDVRAGPSRPSQRPVSRATSVDDDGPNLPSRIQQSITPRRMAHPLLTSSSSATDTHSSPTPSQGGFGVEGSENERRVYSDNEAPNLSRSLTQARATVGSRTMRSFQSSITPEELRASLRELKESNDTLLARHRSSPSAQEPSVVGPSTSRVTPARHAHLEMEENDSIGPAPATGPPFVSWNDLAGEFPSRQSEEWRPSSPGGSMHASDLSDGEQPPRKPLSSFASSSRQESIPRPSTSNRETKGSSLPQPNAGDKDPSSSRSTPTPTLPPHRISPSSPNKTSTSASLSMGSVSEFGLGAGTTSTPVRTATRPGRQLREDEETFHRRLKWSGRTRDTASPPPRVDGLTADNAEPPTAGLTALSVGDARAGGPSIRGEVGRVSPINRNDSSGSLGNRSRTTLAQDEAILAKRLGRAPNSKDKGQQSTAGRIEKSADSMIEQPMVASATERMLGSGSWQVVRDDNHGLSPSLHAGAKQSDVPDMHSGRGAGNGSFESHRSERSEQHLQTTHVRSSTRTEESSIQRTSQTDYVDRRRTLSGEASKVTAAGPSTPPRNTSRSPAQFQVPPTPEDLPSLPHISEADISMASPLKKKPTSDPPKLEMKLSMDTEPRTLVAKAKTHLRAEPLAVSSDNDVAAPFQGPLLRRGGEEPEDWEKVDHPSPQLANDEDDPQASARSSRRSLEQVSKGLSEDLKKPSRSNVSSVTPSSGLSSVPTSVFSSVPTSHLEQPVTSTIPGLPSPGGASQLAQQLASGLQTATPRLVIRPPITDPSGPSTIPGLPSAADSSPERLVYPQLDSHGATVSPPPPVVSLAPAAGFIDALGYAHSEDPASQMSEPLSLTSHSTSKQLEGSVFRIAPPSDSSRSVPSVLDGSVFRIIQPADARSFEEEEAQMRKDLEYVPGKTPPVTPRRSIIRRAQATGEKVIKRLDQGDIDETPWRVKLDLERRQAVNGLHFGARKKDRTSMTILRLLVRTTISLLLLLIFFGFAAEYGRRKGASLRFLYVSPPKIAALLATYDADTPFRRVVSYMAFTRPDAGYFPLDWAGYLWEAVDYWGWGPCR